MEIKEAQVIKKEKMVTMTESELKDIKRECRAYGSRKTRQYISFCFLNYYYKPNTFGGLTEFMSDLAKFLGGYDYIPNTYEWNLFDWLDNNA